MGSRQIVLVSTAGISVLNAGIFWREAKTKRLFSQCNVFHSIVEPHYPCIFFVSLYLFPIFVLSSPFPPIISHNRLPFYKTVSHNIPSIIFLLSISFFSFFRVLFLLKIPHFFHFFPIASSYLSNLSLSPFFLSLLLFSSLFSILLAFPYCFER
jgi:hypothetical protein